MRTAKRFPAGARVIFIGDSITCNGGYIAHVQEYYATHFPADRVLCFNAGVSGGGAGSANRYLEDDLAHFQPTHAVVMLGMNDGWRNLYGDKDFYTLQRSEKNEVYFDRYIKLCERLAARGISMTFCMPTFYDDEVVSETPSADGYSALLYAYGAFARGLAEKYDADIVNFYVPLLHINRELHKINPAATLLKPDRVHPTDVTHVLMARLFLRAQGFTDVKEPTVEDFLAGDIPALSPANIERKKTEAILREIRNAEFFVFGEDYKAPLEKRLEKIEAYFAEEEKGVAHNPFISGLAKSYKQHYAEEENLRARLMAQTEGLYPAGE